MREKVTLNQMLNKISRKQLSHSHIINFVYNITYLLFAYESIFRAGRKIKNHVFIIILEWSIFWTIENPDEIY